MNNNNNNNSYNHWRNQHLQLLNNIEHALLRCKVAMKSTWLSQFRERVGRPDGRSVVQRSSERAVHACLACTTDTADVVPHRTIYPPCARAIACREKTPHLEIWETNQKATHVKFCRHIKSSHIFKLEYIVKLFFRLKCEQLKQYTELVFHTYTSLTCRYVGNSNKRHQSSNTT